MSDKKKIVMIDDEQDLTVMVKINLEDSGKFEVVTLNTAENAEDVVRQENPDLILLDVVMPGRNGKEIVESLKSDDATKDVPIVMVSGKGEMVYNKKKDDFKWMPNSKVIKDRGDLPEAKGAEALSEAYGVNDYVSKPFTTELLIEVIEDVLAKTRKTQSSGDGDLSV